MIKVKNNNNNYEIWTENLTKIYGRGQKQVNAVNGINLRVEPGIHGFLGPNGAGKTTTINMLVGAMLSTSGTARIRGYKIGSIKSRRLLGFLPQDPAFYDNKTGLQYLLYMAQLNGIKKKFARQKALELIKFMDLENAKDRKIGKYSGGMKQKIGIAAALIHEPDILILDEPTANLDPMGRADVIAKIKQLSKRMSVFVSSHILSEVEQMCERVYVINKGKIILADTITNVKQMHSKNSNKYVLDTDANERVMKMLKKTNYIKKIAIKPSDGKINLVPFNSAEFQRVLPQLLGSAGITLKSFFLEESSLQDIFVNIIARDN
ncbi:MAG: ABC transporter ATP-binding protein [Candidatus Lokiarchaeota archaeon]|nr:ABC transporter ATP-binding protein [Candidatus Lokiarchaeota archaeon]